MLYRRWIFGVYPLIVWAVDEQAADRTARVHLMGILERALTS